MDDPKRNSIEELMVLNGNGNGNGRKIFGLSIREIIIIITSLIAMLLYFAKTTAQVSSWQTHIDDRLDSIEKHLDYDDKKLDKLDDSLDNLRENFERHVKDSQ